MPRLKKVKKSCKNCKDFGCYQKHDTFPIHFKFYSLVKHDKAFFTIYETIACACLNWAGTRKEAKDAKEN